MLASRTLSRQRWVCQSCTQKAARRAASSRHHAPASTAAAAHIDLPASFSHHADAENDDRTLRQIFDNQRFWQDFKSSREQVRGQRAGLFQNKYLTSPEGFERYTQATLRKCQSLVSKILSAKTNEQLVPMARDFDRLSDLLCRVIDLSDFVRATHPDRRFQAAATGAYNTMFEFMNHLNTTTALNDQLKKASSNADVTKTWSEEEKTVAFILERDFSKSAIELPEEQRHDFVELSSQIADVGTEFVDKMQPEQPYLKFDSSDLKGVDTGLVKNLTSWGKVTMPTVGTAAIMAMRTAEDDDIRRAVYMANRTASKGSIQRLETMLYARSKLASVCGYDSYAHMALSDKMAKTPEAVNMFLQALLADTRPQVQEELQDLLELKKSDAHSTGLGSANITAWDRDYYTTRLLSGMQRKLQPQQDALSSFFSLGSVFQGLSRLFHRLYGIRFVPREVANGETWNEDVRRIDIVDDIQGHVAVMYCDLFSRPGKSPNPAHFTLRCSRSILADEVAEFSNTPEPFSSAMEAATDGMAHSFDPSTNSVQQLPTIALICDFAIPARVTRQSKPALLSFREVQTLFHEMGHALHSMLGRTSLQNVSGTRCATDFAELPSVLMEQFAFNPQVLGLWARHYSEDRPLNYDLVSSRLEVEKRMAGAETEAQILLAMLDQEYHAKRWTEKSDSTKIYHDVYNRCSSIPEPAGTAWQGFFGHLYGYGATYYSYLFDRAIAGRVWSKVFGDGDLALDPRMGERYKNEVLRWGGARDGWRCVAGVLGDEKLAEGGMDAMREVGKWGVRDIKK